MGFGISVRNASGVEIISEVYRNYQVVSKGTFVNGSGPGTVQAGQVLLLRPYNAVAGSTLKQENFDNGGGWTSSTGSTEFMVIQQGPAATPDTFGVRVFDANGIVTFDSGRAQAVPVSTVRQAVSSTPTAATVTVPAISVAGRKRWIAYPSPADLGWRYARTGANSWLNALITFNSDTSITLDATWTMASDSTPYDANGIQIYCTWHMAAIFEA